ncbi:hypothetical protein BU204_15915 [Actinophytocola xanthii]|uniref:Uncharacterized protein n=1 Tax=Actinophytocola xanthii TaxID=1912961 RepID=A0A1Q8CQE7_9PSEU|nr:hypothetical protein BU204_15915 [Actinophytocola xanthii]
MTARRLLESVEELPATARHRELARQARELAGTPELPALLDELHEAGGDYETRLALHLAHVGGETAFVARCLTASRPAVAGRSLGLAVRLGVDPALLVGLLPELATEARRTLYQHVRRGRAVELAEALLPAVRARFGEEEAAVLLPVCGSATVTAALPDLAFAVTGWGMLAHRHPTVFLDHLDAELDATPRADWERIVTRTGRGIAAAALVEPDRVLGLLARVAPRVQLPRALSPALTALARRDRAGLLAVLLDPRRRGPVPGGRRLWRALLSAGDGDLGALARTLDPYRLVRFLRVLPPARREAVYSVVVGNRDLTADGLPIALLDLLPAAARAREAERLLGLRAVADDPSRRLEITARLPWAQVRDLLRAATRRPTAAERAQAYGCLIAAAALSRDQEAVAEALGSLDRLRNEQDPVRLAAFEALAAVPPWLFRPAEAPALLTLMTDATQARDCSPRTQSRALALIAALVRHGVLSRQPELVDTGVAAMQRLGRRHPWLQLAGLDRELPRGGEHRVFEALLPRIADDARHGRFETALSLARGLGRRAWKMPELQRFVGQAREAAEDNTVLSAIELWLAPPATRDARIGEVLAADRSTITVPAVLRGIGWRRTDLLDEVLREPLHGRFLRRGVRFVPHFAGCFHRWLPRQCAAYADLLARIVEHRKRMPWERVAAVSRLGRVPGTVERLLRYTADQEVAVSEAALSALAWTDAPAEVLAELLGHADTDRARVAVYAASRCARFVRPAELGAALAPALGSRKVTSRKEALRLLAAHRAPDLGAVLAAEWARPDQHRDVRRALVWAARWCLDHERTWDLLAAAAGSEPEVATAVLELDPTTIGPRHRARYAAVVHTVAAAPDPDTARRGLAALPAWSRWDEAGTAMLVRLVGDLTGTARWHHALTALVAACEAREDPAPLTAVVAALRAVPEPTPTADRDLPARRRVLAVADAVAAAAPSSETMRAAAAELAGDLATDPTLRRPVVELATSAVPLDGGAGDLPALVRLAELATGPLPAWQARDALLRRVWATVARLPERHLHEVASALAAREPAPAAPMLALAVAEVAGHRAGWPEHWRELVLALREHADPDVRPLALDIVTSPE